MVGGAAERVTTGNVWPQSRDEKSGGPIAEALQAPSRIWGWSRGYRQTLDFGVERGT